MSDKESEINENIKSLLSSVHEKDNKNEPMEDIKALELAKIIVMELLDTDKNIKSLSVLNQEQIEDITNAYLLNEYYQIDDINKYIDNFLTLKRSTSGFLIEKITSLSMNSQLDNDARDQGFLSRVFRR